MLCIQIIINWPELIKVFHRVGPNILPQMNSSDSNVPSGSGAQPSA